MKCLTLLLVLFSGPAWRLLTSVRDRNVAVAAGAAAYARGNAAQAAGAFAAALAAQTRRPPDPRLVLNLAHAQTRAGEAEAAQATYGRLLANGPDALRSVARQQLAVLLAERGEIARALNQLRQALLLNPRNTGARFDYEVLSDYLAHRPNQPRMPEPATAPAPHRPNAAAEKHSESAAQNQSANKKGTDRKGEMNDSKPNPAPPNSPPQPGADPNGSPDSQKSNGSSGTAAGGRPPGPGTAQPMASGAAPGTRRGLDRTSSAAAAALRGRSTAAGTEAATPDDVQLQTQRARLKAMNLSPAQARQLLETLRAQEQQYLQQLPRPASRQPDPNQPTW